MDWGAGHLTIIVGTGGGAFANKNCPQDRAFEHFFQMPGGLPGGMLAAGIDSHIMPIFQNYCEALDCLTPRVDVSNLLYHQILMPCTITSKSIPIE